MRGTLRNGVNIPSSMQHTKGTYGKWYTVSEFTSVFKFVANPKTRSFPSGSVPLISFWHRVVACGRIRIWDRGRNQIRIRIFLRIIGQK